MNRVYRLVWNCGLGMFVPAMETARSCGKSRSRRSSATVSRAAGLTATLVASLGATVTANANPFLDLSNGLTGWTTAGDVTVTGTTSAFTIGGSPFSLTPATGYNMARIAANGGPMGVNATLGLDPNSLESFLNNGNGSITNFGLMTSTYAFNPGTYSFSWAYAAEDYQPYNDGGVFSLVGGGTQTLISLARNGSSPSDLSGPSPGTLILGSYGSTAWLTTSFTITTAGNYQVGFAAYNWDDTSLSPNLFVSAIAGTFTGTPVQTSGGPPAPTVIGGTGGNVDSDVFDPSSPAYAEPTLTFEGGTLQYTANTTTAKDVVLNGPGGTIDSNGSNVQVTGAISGVGPLVKEGAGTLALAAVNTYSGATTIAGGTLSLTGNGSVAASSGIVNNGILDVSGLAVLAVIKTISGSGAVVLGAQSLTLTQATGSFSGGFSGTGAVTLSGGEMTLAGTSTHSGGTALESGAKLIVASAAALGTGGVTLNSGTLSTAADVTLEGPLTVGAGGGAIEIALDTTTRVTGDISSASPGSACFEKTGAGTLILSGTATIASGTCVQQGSLYSNGQLNSVVTVASTGVLRGTGTITGPVTVRGVLAPGNSPGVLHSTATIEMLPGSVFQPDINGTGTGAGPGNYSRLVIAGADSQFIAGGATLSPNLVNITGTDTYISYVPQVGDAFRIVTAEGGIVGTFASVVQPEGLADATRMEVFYGAAGSQSIDLFVVPVSYGAYVGARDGNQNATSAATAFDQMVELKQAGTASAAQEDILYSLNAQGAALEAVAAQSSGEIHAALAAAAPLTLSGLTNTVGRQGADAATAVWVDVGTSDGEWQSDAVASRFDTSRSQVTIGWDLLNSKQGQFGVGLLHDRVSASLRTDSGSVTQNVGYAYGRYSLRAVLFEGLAAYGLSDWETKRADAFTSGPRLTADMDGHTAFLSAALRLPLSVRGFTVEPYGRFTWERISREAFAESTSLAALAAGRYSVSGARYAVGVTGGSVGQNPYATRFTWQFNAGVGRDDKEIVQSMLGATLGGIQTVLASPDVGRSYFEGGMTGTARFTDRMYGYLGLSGEERSGKSTEVGANVGIRISL